MGGSVSRQIDPVVCHGMDDGKAAWVQVKIVLVVLPDFPDAPPGAAMAFVPLADGVIREQGAQAVQILTVIEMGIYGTKGADLFQVTQLL